MPNEIIELETRRYSQPPSRDNLARAYSYPATDARVASNLYQGFAKEASTRNQNEALSRAFWAIEDELTLRRQVRRGLQTADGSLHLAISEQAREERRIRSDREIRERAQILARERDDKLEMGRWQRYALRGYKELPTLPQRQAVTELEYAALMTVDSMIKTKSRVKSSFGRLRDRFVSEWVATVDTAAALKQGISHRFKDFNDSELGKGFNRSFPQFTRAGFVLAPSLAVAASRYFGF